jgi:hypothetical protein
MTRASTGFLMAAAVLLGGWAGVTALRRAMLNRAQVLGLLALELLLAAQAVISLITLAAGHEASEAGTHVVYLAGSLLVLPILIGVPVRMGFPATAGSPGTDPEFVGGIEVSAPGTGSADRFRAAIAAMACLAIVVMLSRMWVTWQSGGTS